MAYKIMNKNKIGKESENVETARDKGVTPTEWLENLSNQQLNDEEHTNEILSIMLTTVLCGWPYKDNENDYKIYNKNPMSYLFIPYSFFNVIIKFLFVGFKKRIRFFFVFYFIVFLTLFIYFLADIHYQVKEKKEPVRLLSNLDYDRIYLNGREFQIIGRYE